MRIQRLAVAGFRGFPRLVEFDLDADAVVVGGVNGSGKTSFFDAILWSLCGAVPRLGDEPASIISEYSPSGEARVELRLIAGDRSSVTVIRRFDGAMHLSVQVDRATPVTGASADAALIDLLWPDAKSAADQLRALTRSLTRATYLQQDAVREFVDADTEQNRFQVVSELVGAGRIGELQRQLESSRNAWTRAATSLKKDIAPLENRRKLVADRLARLGAEAADADVDTGLGAWSAEVAELLGASSGSRSSRLQTSAEDIDRYLRELSADEQRTTRAMAATQRLLDHLTRPPAEPADMAPLNAALAEAGRRRGAASESLEAAQRLAAESRRRQVELEERTASLRALAQLALQHLDEHCPVCDQTYDREATHARLEALLDTVGSPAPEHGSSPNVAAAAAELADAERDLASQQTALRNAEDAAARRAQWTQVLAALRDEIEGGERIAAPQDASSRLEELVQRLDVARRLRIRGNDLSLSVARAAELAQRQELSEQLAESDAALARQRQQIEDRDETAEVASQVINALRAAGSEVVGKELTRIEPLLQRIFATVDPHPSFRVVSFLTKTVRGRGQLWTTLDDVAGDVNVQDPAIVLSSSQLNVLAVAIFLALNLAIPTLPLQVVALDDPLQSLDTINLLGLTDLLRRVKQTRQVIVSTHDERLASLLERKLRPVTESERSVRIDLHGWTPSGPLIEQRDLPQDVAGLRLVASA